MVCFHGFCDMQSDHFYFYAYYKFTSGLLRRILEWTLNSFAFALPKPEEVLRFKSGWTQLVKIKLPVAMALVYLSSAPEPTIPMVYSRSVCVCVCDGEREQRVKSEGKKWGEDVDTGRQRGHRCGWGNGDKLHLLAVGGSHGSKLGVRWYHQIPRNLTETIVIYLTFISNNS